MSIKCPHCGTELTLDDALYGRCVLCGTCGKEFVARSRPKANRTMLDFIRNKIEIYIDKMWWPHNIAKMQGECPYCGVEFNAQQGDFGKLHTCGSCYKEFYIPNVYICPNDGYIEWDWLYPLTSFFKRYEWVIGCAAWGFISWACFSFSKTASNSFHSVAQTFFEAIMWLVGSILKTWQGIVSLVLWLVVWQIEDAGHHKCSECKKKLLDLNSPMGWKLYMDLYGNKAKSSVNSDSHTYYA